MSASERPLTYPKDRVVGIAEDRRTLAAVREELASAGIADDRLEVLCSEETADRMDPDDTDGPVEGAVRVVQKALGEEARRLQVLTDAMEAGAYAVTVSVSDAEDDETKRSIGRALHDAGATHVAFYGPWAIEELQFGA